MSDLRLKLFIAGDSPRAREEAANLARAVSTLEDDGMQVETVDVLENPEAANEYRILTTITSCTRWSRFSMHSPRNFAPNR